MSGKKQLVITRQAKEDLLAIWLHIAEDSPANADAFIDAIEERFAPLTEFPKLGTDCVEFGLGLRVFPFRNYLIFYRASDDAISIVHIFHGARDLSQLFIEPD